MENKLTAVDFLADNLHYLHSTKWDDILIKAKEMEKEQIELAFCEGVDDEYEYHINNSTRKNSEQYYNDTYIKQ